MLGKGVRNIWCKSLLGIWRDKSGRVMKIQVLTCWLRISRTFTSKHASFLQSLPMSEPKTASKNSSIKIFKINLGVYWYRTLES